MDHTSIHPMSANLAQLIDLHLWRGPPQNSDPDHPVQILVNHGYVVGFCPTRLQPAWSAYRVAHATGTADFERPIHYHDDLRLPEEQRIGRKTFGKLGNVGIDVGHMTPNEVINRQFGRLAQMETFLMSNMSPQYGTLNKGVWLKLETAIRSIQDEQGKDHVWAIVGPVFGDQPASLNRGAGKFVPVPDAYFAIVVDPQNYPYDRISNAKIDCFIMPQSAPPASNPQDYPSSLPEIEAATGLKFFTDWGRELPVAIEAQLMAQSDRPGEPSRLMQVLESKALEWDAESAEAGEALPTANTIDGLIESLQAEAAALQILGRALSDREQNRLGMIQHTISWLIAARDLAAKPKAPAAAPVNLITYKIVSDMDDRLKEAARIACNFWNRFLEPGFSVVIRLGTFTQLSNTIARAYRPYEDDGVKYGVVEFNTRFLATYTPFETAGTIVHEIGHTLGIGWAEWDALFDKNTGKFKSAAIQRLPALQAMEVERDGGSGTALSHWDEVLFDKELMTGYKDRIGETVLPVTIDVMRLLGHNVSERLEGVRLLEVVLGEVANMVFSRQDEARSLNLDHFVPTEMFETIPHASEEDQA